MPDLQEQKKGDVEATACIAIADITTMLGGQPFPPFALNPKLDTFEAAYQ